MAAPAEAQPFNIYDFELVPDTGRDAAQADYELRAWRNSNGDLLSTGVAVATIRPPQDEVDAALAAIAENGNARGIVSIPDPELKFNDHQKYLHKWELLTSEIRLVVGGLAATLQKVVDADIARSTAEMRRPIGHGQVRIDDGPKQPQAWHADNLYPTAAECVFEAGMQRYVVTLGAPGPNGESPSTDFLEGVTRGQRIVGSFMHDPIIGEARTITHPAGTVVRFDGRFGIHRVPEIYGPRILATTSALEIAAR